MKYFILFLLLTLLFSCENESTGVKKSNQQANKEKQSEYAYSNNDGMKSSGEYFENNKTGIWKYYSKKEVLQKVELYNDDGELIHVLDKDDFIFKRMQLNGVGIDVPKFWKTEDQVYPVIFSCYKICDTCEFVPNITITKDRLIDDLDFKDYMKKSYATLESRFDAFKPVAQGSLRIDNKPAYQIVYILKTKGVDLGGITTWINDGEQLYIITCMSENDLDNASFLKYKDLFREIINSFFVI